MLTRVYEDRRRASELQGVHYGLDLHEVGASPDDAHDAHGLTVVAMRAAGAHRTDERPIPGHRCVVCALRGVIAAARLGRSHQLGFGQASCVRGSGTSLCLFLQEFLAPWDSNERVGRRRSGQR